MLTRKCDLCDNQASVDTKTIYGYWAYLCPACNERYGRKAFQTKLDTLTEGGTKIKLSGTMKEIPMEVRDGE